MDSQKLTPTTPCNLCGSSEAEPTRLGKRHPIVRCRSCGLICVNPVPPAAELACLYDGGQASPLAYYVLSAVADWKTFDYLFEMLMGEPDFPPLGRVLDVGSGTGVFLEHAKKRGWRVFGVELSREHTQHCRRLGLPVVHGTFFDLSPPAEPWDFVFMGDVIEHLPDPKGVLRGIWEQLRPGGFLLISTPNIDSWAARLLQVKPEEHLFYFTRATLSRMLQETGFSPAWIRKFDRHHNLRALPFSSTFQARRGRLFAWMAALLRRLPMDMVLRLPLGENLLALARKKC